MSYPLQVMLVSQGLFLSTPPPGIPVLSRSDCVTRCFQHPACESIYYNRLSRICHIQEAGNVEDDGETQFEGMEQLRLTVESCAEGYIWSHSLYLCFKVHHVKMNWTAAHAQCKQEGGQLLTVDTLAKQYLVNYITENMSYGRVWLGGRLNESEWRWHDSTPVHTFYWNDDEPNGGQQKCLAFIQNKKTILKKWHDVRCSTQYNLICEMAVMHQLLDC